jgi:hypothetical protein
MLSRISLGDRGAIHPGPSDPMIRAKPPNKPESRRNRGEFEIVDKRTPGARQQDRRHRPFHQLVMSNMLGNDS